jgi:hypothetical protein
MNCTICGEKIVLVPSATERAKKAGGTPADYTVIFTAHIRCALDKRRFETLELIRRCYSD